MKTIETVVLEQDHPTKTQCCRIALGRLSAANMLLSTAVDEFYDANLPEHKEELEEVIDRISSLISSLRNFR